jgi:heparan-alpha-glucosaminide N-acetyltransferase
MGSYILLRDREVDFADSTNCIVEQNRFEIESELAKRLSNSKLDGAGNGAKAADVKQRLKSLDVFRGLTVALMILVDDAGGILPTINHSPWNGVTIADFVMPFFLFIVGVALALVYKNVSDKVVTTQKAILRTTKIFVLGIILQGGYFHGLNNLSYGVDLVHIRWFGVLQRIAIGYFLAAMCEIWLTSNSLVDSFPGFAKKYCIQWVVAVLLSALYVGCLYGLYVPDWQFEVPTINFHGTSLNNGSAVQTVKCGLRGSLGPACNAVRMIDYSVLGVKHLYQHPVYKRTKECSVNSPDYGPLPSNAPVWCQAPFDPEGLLSSVMASVTCFIGLHFGHILVNFKDHRERILNWIISSLVLILFGIFLDVLGMPLNKALYTFSYMCITSGAAGLLFSAIYSFVDMFGYRRPTVLLEWMGLNALLIYALAACDLFAAAIQGFYWKSPQNNVVTAVEALFEAIVHSKSWGKLAYVLFEIFFWSLVAGLLHMKRIYMKL